MQFPAVALVIRKEIQKREVCLHIYLNTFLQITNKTIRSETSPIARKLQGLGESVRPTCHCSEGEKFYPGEQWNIQYRMFTRKQLKATFCQKVYSRQKGII